MPSKQHAPQQNPVKPSPGHFVPGAQKADVSVMHFFSLSFPTIPHSKCIFFFFTTSRCVYSFTTVIVRLLTYSACRWICDRSIWSRRLPISLQEGRLMGGIAHGLVCPLVSMFAYTIDRSTTGENDTENVCFKLLY